MSEIRRVISKTREEILALSNEVYRAEQSLKSAKALYERAIANCAHEYKTQFVPEVIDMKDHFSGYIDFDVATGKYLKQEVCMVCGTKKPER